MKNSSKNLFWVAAILFLFSPFLAQGRTVPTASLTASLSQDLGVSEPAILPTNPFYFLKRWQQDVNLFFTFNNFKKASTALDYSLEKSIELQQVAALAPDNTPAIVRATSNFSDSIDTLPGYLLVLQKSNLPSNDQTLNNFVQNYFAKSVSLEELATNLSEQFRSNADLSQGIMQANDKFDTEVLDNIFSLLPQENIFSMVQSYVNSASPTSQLEALATVNTVANNNSKYAPLAQKVQVMVLMSLNKSLRLMDAGTLKDFQNNVKNFLLVYAGGNDLLQSFSTSTVPVLNNFSSTLSDMLAQDLTSRFQSATTSQEFEDELNMALVSSVYGQNDTLLKQSLLSASSTAALQDVLQNKILDGVDAFLQKSPKAQNSLSQAKVSGSDQFESMQKTDQKALDEFSEGVKYFQQGDFVSAFILLRDAENSLVTSLTTSSVGAKVRAQACSIQILDLKGVCALAQGTFVANNQCPALSQCTGADIKTTPQPSVAPDNVPAPSLLLQQPPEVSPGATVSGTCSEDQVVCPSFSVTCSDGSVLQYGGGCAASFDQCDIQEPQCPSAAQ